MSQTRLNAMLREILRLPVYLYRWHCGRLLGRRFLLLTHVGRHTGLRRRTVLEVMECREAGPELIVMSGFGRDAGWLRNIEAKSGAEVIVGSRRFSAVHRWLDADEAVRVLAGYERHNRVAAPIIRAALSNLVGWRYEGSDEARRRLVAQLPLIAFRLCS
jgi:deazaflavin-dependent oxidoreductase (nitroreductase family)